MVVVAAGIYCRLSAEEWRWIILAIGLILVAEAFNSAVEQLGDAITTASHPNLRFAKDVAAGAVLVAIVAAILIGVTIFGPRLTALLQ